MEKICDFCTALRPAIYCEADEAHLCLSCDTKIHSANELSSRHQRSILCDICRHHPSYVRCLEHRIFMCHTCDRSLHEESSLHQKQLISFYMGCPSAKDFAVMWGFDLDGLNNDVSEHRFISASFGCSDSNKHNFGIQPSPKTRSSSLLASCVEFEMGSFSRSITAFFKGKEKQNTCFVLQQILELERLQFEGNNSLPSIRYQEHTGIPSLNPTISKKLDKNLDLHTQHSSTDLRQRDHTLEELEEEPLSFSLSQVDHLPSSSISLHGESFWQCKSPIQSSQFWSQTIQDLGVCEELVGHDDFSIPEVDATFQNFEELFGGDQDPEKDVPCSSVEKDMSIGTIDDKHPKIIEDDAVASLVYMVRPTRNATDCVTKEVYPDDMGMEPEDKFENAHHESRENAITRYKEKKKSRMNDKQIRYGYRKSRTDKRSKYT